MHIRKSTLRKGIPYKYCVIQEGKREVHWENYYCYSNQAHEPYNRTLQLTKEDDLEKGNFRKYHD